MYGLDQEPKSVSTKKDLKSKTYLDANKIRWILGYAAEISKRRNPCAGFYIHFHLFLLLYSSTLHRMFHQKKRFLTISFSLQLSKPHCHLWGAGEYLSLMCQWANHNSWDACGFCFVLFIFFMTIWRQYKASQRNEKYNNID